VHFGVAANIKVISARGSPQGVRGRRRDVQAIFCRRRHQAEKATARQDQAGNASTGDGGFTSDFSF
jgi:hypothetical protein